MQRPLISCFYSSKYSKCTLIGYCNLKVAQSYKHTAVHLIVTPCDITYLGVSALQVVGGLSTTLGTSPEVLPQRCRTTLTSMPWIMAYSHSVRRTKVRRPSGKTSEVIISRVGPFAQLLGSLLNFITFRTTVEYLHIDGGYLRYPYS